MPFAVNTRSCCTVTSSAANGPATNDHALKNPKTEPSRRTSNSVEPATPPATYSATTWWMPAASTSSSTISMSVSVPMPSRESSTWFMDAAADAGPVAASSSAPAAS
jgi:hypothetical protein